MAGRLALSPGFPPARRALAMFYLRKRRIDEAIAEFSTDLVNSGEGTDVPALAQAIRIGGLKSYHRWDLDRLKRLSQQQYVSPVG